MSFYCEADFCDKLADWVIIHGQSKKQLCDDHLRFVIGEKERQHLYDAVEMSWDFVEKYYHEDN